MQMNHTLIFGHSFTQKLRFYSETGIRPGVAWRESERYGDRDFFQIGNNTGNWLTADYVQNQYDRVDALYVNGYTNNRLIYRFADNLNVYLFNRYSRNVASITGNFSVRFPINSTGRISFPSVDENFLV